MRFIAATLAAAILTGAVASAQEQPPVFEVSNPYCRTGTTAAGSYIQVIVRAKLIDHRPSPHTTMVMHVWYTDRDDRRGYLNSLRNELFVKDPNELGSRPVHPNNPDLDIQPGEIAVFRQDKFFHWSDTGNIRCGRMAFYRQGQKIPVVINKEWRFDSSEGWVNQP